MKTKSAHQLFGTSKDLETGKGVTLEYPGFSITVHRAGGSNKKYAQILSDKFKPVRQKYQQGLLSADEEDRIVLEAFVEGVVVGWSGNIGPGGKKAAYSVANCLKVFEELPDLYYDVKAQAQKAATFRQETEDADEKN